MQPVAVLPKVLFLLLVFSCLDSSRHFLDAFTHRGFIPPPSLSDPAGKRFRQKQIGGMLLATLRGRRLVASGFALSQISVFFSS